MNKKQLEKIIAREGLIIFVFLFISLSAFLYGHNVNKSIYKKYFDEVVVFSPKFQPLEKYTQEYEVKTRFYNIGLAPCPLTKQEKFMLEKGYNVYPSYLIKTFGFYLLILGYPLYLLIRFILWSVRTLKEK